MNQEKCLCGSTSQAIVVSLSRLHAPEETDMIERPFYIFVFNLFSFLLFGVCLNNWETPYGHKCVIYFISLVDEKIRKQSENLRLGRFILKSSYVTVMSHEHASIFCEI